MAQEKGKTRYRPTSGRGRLYLAALLALTLLVFVGLRLRGWQEQRQDSREVLLVNPWNYLDESRYRPRLIGVGGGMKLDRSCAAACKRMLADCEAAGHDPELRCAYRSREEQAELFERQLQALQERGLDEDEAWEQAAQSVSVPGTSEHELGLAVDIADRRQPQLDESQAQTGTQQWLMANCWRYGFILRYPEGARELTGVDYKPWHYRYVGEETARQISVLGITLEEYTALFYKEEAEIVFDDAA